ncbi:STAS domain-containing protein [Solidesulfovibrio magneticus]|uniref:Anti-sigma factor antagonist n=1 Tax=Solidesulfovibrio magneticus (strain ATCC 700980 / DSM 13731 / RS-1) TaxID=573370 RepID=C4XP82_SOLM1|nr:STAS domain-containing protein [Solidesulfovibrio magneticus]BAH77576.1 anti-sigma factor antagonist family protein [Solidesulfovibrio magneticus RS-1]
MSVKVSFQETDAGQKVLTIALSGRFDIYTYEDFGKSYKDNLEPGVKIVLDMSGLEYLDSSALGMLLMMRERAGGASADITIVMCSPEVAKILSTVKFDKLFHMAS